MKSGEQTRAFFPLLLDTPATVTKPYSQEGFHTYIVDPAGIVQADLAGTKTKRPTAEADGKSYLFEARRQACYSLRTSARWLIRFMLRVPTIIRFEISLP